MEENTGGGNTFDLPVFKRDWCTEFCPGIYTGLAYAYNCQQ
jgi:hypothetical protein